MMMRRKGFWSLTGFTLSELLLAAAILAFALTGLLLFFVNSIILNETNRNFTIAYSAIQAKMEEMKNTNFDELDIFNGTNFDLDGFSSGNGQGRIMVSNEATDLKRIRIVACFKVRNRLIGNDINNCQSSPAELVTLIAR
mgnify:CR=1 FL=1